MKAKQFVQALDHAKITAAIGAAERTTSGEIRVFITHRTDVQDAVQRAGERFLKLGMEKTAGRNGVLLYFAPAVRKFALVGDRGIHAKVGGDGYWQEVVGNLMQPLLKEGRYTEAIVAAVEEVGRQLAAHFPPGPGDNPNELPDTVEEEGPESDDAPAPRA